MATSVSMQSPIPDYGNFGQVAANQWNAAQERALKEDLHNAEMDLERDKHDLNEWSTRENAKINWAQQGLAEDYYGLRKERHDLEMDEWNYKLKQRADQKKLAQAKLQQTLHNERLEKRFQDEYEEPAWYESAADWLTPDIFGYDLYDAVDTKEEWMDEQGVEYSDYFDLYDDPNINYKDLDIESLRYLRETDPSFDWGIYGSDDNLADLLSQ
jgi:hypothetical protein